MFHDETNIDADMKPRFTSGFTNSTYELQQCTRQHWSIFSDEDFNSMMNRFSLQSFKRFYCLPLNYSKEVKGFLDDIDNGVGD